MAIATEIFYVDRGVERAHKLDELLIRLRRDALIDLSIFERTSGKTQIVVTYAEVGFLLVQSSPPDGYASVGVTSPLVLIFDELLATNLNTALACLVAYRNGAPVTLTSADLEITGNGLIITGLIDGTTGAYYQVVVRKTLPSQSGRTLERDFILTFST